MDLWAAFRRVTLMTDWNPEANALFIQAIKPPPSEGWPFSTWLVLAILP